MYLYNPGFDVLATALSLSMDAFSVSICMGICRGGLKWSQSSLIASAFGFFQFGMPLAGALLASCVTGYMNSWASWIGSAMIAYVGINMIWESLKGGESCDCTMELNLKNLALLSVATSLDALAVGFSIQSVGGRAYPMAFWSGLITFGMSLLVARAGCHIGEKIGSRSETVGGVVLCVIAVKVFCGSF